MHEQPIDADRLIEIGKAWNQDLEHIDSEYAKALASGDRDPTELYSRYLESREASSTKHSADLTAALTESAEEFGADTSGATVPVLPPLRAAYPPPRTQGAPHLPPTPARNPELQRKRRSTSGHRRPVLWVTGVGLAVFGIAALVVFAPTWFDSPQSTAASNSSSSTASSHASTSTKEVLYEVEGTTKSANITYQTPSGTAQGSSKKVPLGLVATGNPGIKFAMAPGDFVYLAAQNNEPSGTITCVISVNGRVLSKVTSSGGYAVASCDGRVP